MFYGHGRENPAGKEQTDKGVTLFEALDARRVSASDCAPDVAPPGVSPR